MQKFYNIIFVIAAVLIIYFGVQALAGPQDDKISAFNSSLADEEKGNYNEAINKLMKVYDANKQNYLINLRLGWLHYNKGSYDQSKKYYKTALNIASEKSVEALIGLTLPLAALNEWETVSETYDKILKIDPMNYTANLRLGQIYLNRGDYKNAKTHLDKLFRIFPSEYEVNLSLGWTNYYLGNKQAAKDNFTSALMLSPKDTLASRGYNLVR